MPSPTDDANSNDASAPSRPALEAVAARSTATPKLHDQLARLRRALRRWIGTAAAARLVWLLLAILFVDAGADWLLEWERGVRIALACAAVVGLLFATQRWFVRPCLRLPTDARLAWQVERAHPATAGVLVNAVEFTAQITAQVTAQVTEPNKAQHASQTAVRTAGSSDSLIAATCQQAEQLAATLDFTDVLDKTLEQRHRRTLAAGLFVLVGMTVLASSTVLGRTWFRRNVTLADIPWPRDTHIRVVGADEGRLRVPRGGATVVRIEIAETSERIPEVLEVDFRPRRSQPPSSLTRRSPREFDLALRDLLDPFRLRVRGGDGRTEWIDVELLDPPWLRDIRITSREPEYLGGRSTEFNSGAGPFSAPRGSRIEITGVATKPLQSATLFRMNKSHKLSSSSEDASPLTLSESTRFTGQFTADKPGSELWSLDVRDADGLSTPRPEQFRLEVVNDPPPEVRARWRGASRMLVPGGALTLEADVRDNSQVTRVLVLARSVKPEEQPGMASEVPRPNPREPTASVVELVVNGAAAELPAQQRSVRERIDLGPLDLRLGDVLELVCAADDNDVLYGPHRGRSSGLLLRVVTPAEFRADVQRREKEQRQHLQQSLDDHAVWLEQLRSSDKSAAQLLSLARRHAALTTALSGPLEVTRSLVDELSHQFAESAESAAIERLDRRVVTPLARAHGELSAIVQAELNAARRGDPDASVARALAAQEQLVEQLRQAIAALSGVEGFQEAVTLLEELLAAQDSVRRQTTDAEQARVRAALESNSRSP